MNKIRIFIFAIFVIFFTQPVKAQKIGILGGYNAAFLYSSWEGRETKSNRIKNGFQIGPFIELPVFNSFIVKSGIIFSLKGSRNYSSFEEITWEDDTRYNLFYLDFPVMIKKEFSIFGFPFYAEAGAYMAYGISGYVVTDGVNSNNIVREFDRLRFSSKSQNWPSAFRMDYGFTAGIGKEFKNFNLGVAYFRGIRDTDSKFDYVVHNEVYSLYASYAFFNKRNYNKIIEIFGVRNRKAKI